MPTPDEVREALKEVIDPELGVNVVDLGLVYGIELKGELVHITMTMTTPACPLGEHISNEAREVLLGQFHELREVEVEIVYSPPWAPELMTDAAKEQLGWSGR